MCRSLCVTLLALGLLTASAAAQQPPDRRPTPPPGGERDNEPRPRGEFPYPPSPLVQALDADRDGTISTDEIKAAPEALRKLDRNNDGQLTREELRPEGRPGGGPPFGGRGGPERGGDRPTDRPREGDRPDDRPPFREGFTRPRIEVGTVMPSFLRERLDLSREQQEQLTDLEKDVKAKLEKILTADQKERIEQMIRRVQGGPRGPGDERPETDRPGRPERPESGTRPERPEDGARPERPERPERD